MGGLAGGWMTSQAGCQWMTGANRRARLDARRTLPAAMMGGATGTDPGTVMGTLFANAPGPRVSPAQARRARQPGPGRGQHRPGRPHHHLHHHEREPGRALPARRCPPSRSASPG